MVMGPAEAADQLAGLLEFTFGHGVWEDAREVAYTALESCRTALRGAITPAPRDAISARSGASASASSR